MVPSVLHTKVRGSRDLIQIPLYIHSKLAWTLLTAVLHWELVQVIICQDPCVFFSHGLPGQRPLLCVQPVVAVPRCMAIPLVRLKLVYPAPESPVVQW